MTKKEQANVVVSHLNQYLNQKCIKANIIVTPILYLYFGNMVLVHDLRKHPKSGKIHLETDYILTFQWHWTVYDNNRIIASSRISEGTNEYSKAQDAIQIFKDRILLDFEYNSGANELNLHFEGGITLRSFNDVVPGMVKDTKDTWVFIAWGSTEYNACYTNGKIENGLRTVTYVYDYLENKDEYHF